MLLMNYLNKIEAKYSIVEQRVVILREEVMANLRSILVNLYNPIEIKT